MYFLRQAANKVSTKGEDDVLRSTAQLMVDVCPPPGFPRDDPKVGRLEEIYGVLDFGICLLGKDSLFDCRSSTKTAQETSRTCAVEWVQSTVYMWFNVCSRSE